MREAFALLIAFLLSAGSVRADTLPGSVTDVAGWRLGAYTDDKSGKFSHCAASAPYKSGITMFFAVSNDFTWRVGWSHPDWRFTVGQQVDLSMYVDGAGPYKVTGIAKTKDLALAELAATTALFDAFRKGFLLTVNAQGNTYKFNLDGTFAALTEVLECTRRYVGVRPAASPPAPIISSPSPQPQRAPTRAVTSEQRLEAMTVVANVLAQGDLAGFKILTSREVKEMKLPDADTWDVVWKAEDVIGTLRIIPKGAVGSAAEIATAMISEDSRSCTGQFASGSTPDEKNPNVVRMFTGCNGKNGAHEVRYVAIPLEEGGFYLFATLGLTKTGDPKTAVAKTDALLRNAVFEILKR